MRRVKSGNAANIVSPDSTRTGISIFARRNAPVVATQDGKIVRMGVSKRLGRFIQLQDVYGNTYTYGGLGEVAKAYPAPKPKTVTARQVARELDLPKADPTPRPQAASAGTQPSEDSADARRVSAKASAVAAPAAEVTKERLFANPDRPAAFENGGETQLLDSGAEVPGYTTFKNYFTQVFGLEREDVVLKRLKVGSRVIAGTIIGRIGKAPSSEVRAAHALRDPPRRQGRPADRPEADPRRLEAARDHGHLPRRRQEPVLRPRRQEPVHRPDPADEQVRAPAPRARPTRASRSTSAAAATSSPVASTAASSRRSSSSPPAA